MSIKDDRPITDDVARPTLDAPTKQSVSRRQLMAGALVGSIGATLSGCARTDSGSTLSVAASSSSQAPERTRKLIRNATVITQDPTLKVLHQTDILIEGDRIAAIGPNLSATDAEVIDAANMVAMPGFIDTHRHMWQGSIRRVFPDVTLGEYFGSVLAALGPQYRPDDVYVGDLVSALSAIDAGITTILDWSHIQNTPQHTDSAIAALKASGMRAVFGYGTPQLGNKSLAEDKNHRYPQDIKRLRSQYFSSEDQLLTLALAPDGPSFGPVEPSIGDWRAAAEVNARITVHIMGAGTLSGLKTLHSMGLLNNKTTYVHCTNLPDEAWQLIVKTGGTVSIASTVEMQMGHGVPAVQESLDHGIRPSLSADVETSAPNDMFSQMRSVLSLQRMLVQQRGAKGEKKLPALLTTADVLDFATLEGARANGLDSKVGSLTPGKQADLILLRKDRINVVPLKDPIGTVVLGMDTSNIDSVFVAGKALKRNGLLLGVDLKSLSEKAAASQEYLLSKAGLA